MTRVYSKYNFCKKRIIDRYNPIINFQFKTFNKENKKGVFLRTNRTLVYKLPFKPNQEGINPVAT